jgi:hypothetical protein
LSGKVVLTFPPLEKKGAKTTINNEFKIPNQVAGTSVSVELNSLPTPKNNSPDYNKTYDRIRLPVEYFLKVSRKQLNQHVCNNQ